MGYCNHCEKEVARGKFCKTCGHQLVQSTDAEISKKTNAIPAIKMTYMSLLAHLLPLLLLLIGLYVGGMFFLIWVPGYVIRFLAANNPADKRQATESMNYAFLFTAVYLFSGFLIALKMQLAFNAAQILMLLILLISLVSMLWGIIKVSLGKEFKYPLSLRLVK